jgi:threonine/homoserine efflux transporter RhtA
VPTDIILLIQVVTAERLRKSRNVRFVRMLRTVLWIDLAAAGVGLVIDMSEFPDSVPLDMLAVIWPAVWLPYFYRSKRVKRVFETRDWVPVVAAAPSAT